MKILVVEPEYAPYEKEIPDTLEAEQAIVGGLITGVDLSVLDQWSKH